MRWERAAGLWGLTGELRVSDLPIWRGRRFHPAFSKLLSGPGLVTAPVLITHSQPRLSACTTVLKASNYVSPRPTGALPNAALFPWPPRSSSRCGLWPWSPVACRLVCPDTLWESVHGGPAPRVSSVHTSGPACPTSTMTPRAGSFCPAEPSEVQLPVQWYAPWPEAHSASRCRAFGVPQSLTLDVIV